jgi:hypothetical protein
MITHSALSWDNPGYCVQPKLVLFPSKVPNQQSFILQKKNPKEILFCCYKATLWVRDPVKQLTSFCWKVHPKKRLTLDSLKRQNLGFPQHHTWEAAYPSSEQWWPSHIEKRCPSMKSGDADDNNSVLEQHNLQPSVWLQFHLKLI